MDAILDRLEKLATRLENVEKQLQSAPASAPAPSGGSDDASPAVAEFQTLIDTHIKAFVEATAKLNDSALTEAVGLLKQAIDNEASLIGVAATSKKPADDKFMGLFKPIIDAGNQIAEIVKKNPKTKVPNHLKTISEGINVLAWVTVTPTPMNYVKETTGSSQFYSNKILVEFKGKDENQTGWVGHWDAFLKALIPYIKQYHTTGLTWNARGGEVPVTLPGASSAPAPTSAPAPSDAPAAPAPPPPPPSNLLADLSSGPSSGKTDSPDMGGVFRELNKGTDITKSLKHVDRSQMTHKNPELRGKNVVPANIQKKPATSSAAAKKPAVVKNPVGPVKQGNKWIVEHHVNNSNLVIEGAEAKDSVMLYACKGSRLVIKGKINNIFIDNCQKTGVVFDSAISSCDVVNCKSVEIQCTAFVPCFNIDKTDGAQLYLSKECSESEIVTAKSSEMNITIPGDNDNDEPIEMPVPEQYKTRIVNKKLVTETMVHE